MELISVRRKSDESAGQNDVIKFLIESYRKLSNSGEDLLHSFASYNLNFPPVIPSNPEENVHYGTLFSPP